MQHNFCGIRVRYKQENGSYSSWKTLLASTTLTSEEVNTGALYEGALLVTNTYIAQVDVVDTIGNHTSVTVTIPTDKVFMHKDGARNSLGLFKYAEDDNMVDIAEDITVKVRGDLVVGGRTISDTGWISLGLSDEVAEAALNTGRNGKGCFYRVVNGKHVHVAFNCSFDYNAAAITVSAAQIPAAYKPSRNTYAMNPTNGRGIARSFVNSSGDVRIDYVQNMATAETTNAYAVNWIDGYIDYWV